MPSFILLIFIFAVGPPLAAWAVSDQWNDPRMSMDTHAGAAQRRYAPTGQMFPNHFETGARIPGDDTSSIVPIASRPPLLKRSLFRLSLRERNSTLSNCELLPQTTATTMVERNGHWLPAGGAFPALNDASGSSVWAVGACSGEAMR
ncbi:hypothetical protein ABE494_08100 [Stenotrophomonas lactitubi]|uniref:hypothetical protein n=1 Tax=Stenotrophomonas lactitubi TaxID=2045214 RepID=UPI0032080B55